MNKLFLVASLLLLGSLAYAQNPFNEYKTKVIEVNEKTIAIKDSPEFVVGASGIVSHVFDAKSSSIIAHVTVLSKDGSKALLNVDKFQMLSQGAFPDSGLKPSVGDNVTINYLYDRALIVAPNQSTYNELTKKYKTLTWIHPDVVSAYLSKLYRPNPDKTIFQTICYQNAASLIMFAIKDKGYFVDCHNFNTLKTVDISNTTDTQLPFYSRINTVESSWFSWNSSKISDYNTYYTTLIRK